MIARSVPRIICVVGLALACKPEAAPPVPAGQPAPAAAPIAPPPTMTAAPEDSTPLVVFVGTSLTAGFGLPDTSLAYPSLIQRKIDAAKLGVRVVNAGISGETSAGALARIDWILRRGNIRVLVIETGANDGLRGQDPDTTRANIQTILDRAKALDPPPKVVIAGMEAMPNLGEDYTRRFRAVFPSLAEKNGAVLVPFLLEGVAGIDSLNQADGIHPSPRGHQVLADNVWKVLKGVLSSAGPR